MHDVVTDIRAAPQQFPPSSEEIRAAMEGRRLHEGDDASLFLSPEAEAESNKNKSSGEGVGREKEQWEWLHVAAMDMTYACGGMARAALWLLAQVGRKKY